MLMGFGLNIPNWRTGGGVSAAAAFLATNGPHGMVLDFADASIAIDDAANLLDLQSQGQVSGGALVGPGAKLTYTAPSVKLTEQSDGFLKFQAHNLAGYSEDFTRAGYWTNLNSVTSTANGATDYAGNLTATSFTGNGVANQPGIVNETVTHLVGATYSFSFDWKNVSSDSWIKFTAPGGSQAWFDTANLVVGTMGSAWVSVVGTPIGNGYVRITATYVPTSTLYLYTQVVNSNNSVVTTNKSGVFYLCRGQIRRTPSASDYIATTSAAAYDLPYVYSGGSRIGIMVEPAATNLLPRSAMGTALGSWNGNNSTRTLSAEIDPFGGYAAMQIATNGNGGLNVSQPVSVTPGSVYTASIFLKGTPGEKIFFMADAAFQVEVTFTGQWQRITKTFTATTNPTYFGCERYNRSGGAHLPDVTFHATGAQLETGTVATSPIITYGSTVLRAADTPNALLNLFPAIGTAYTIYAKYKPQSASVATTAIRLDDTTANELVSLGNNASGQGLATVTDGGVAQAAITSGTITASAFHRVAASVEANNVRFVVNGGTEVQNTSVTLPTLTRLLLTAGGGMELAQLAILPGARTEAQLQALGA